MEKGTKSKNVSIADIMIRKLRLEEEETGGVLADPSNTEAGRHEEATLGQGPPLLDPAAMLPPRTTNGRPSTSWGAQGPGGAGGPGASAGGRPPPRPGTSGGGGGRLRPRPQTSSGRASSQLDFFGMKKNTDARMATASHDLKEALQGAAAGDPLVGILAGRGGAPARDGALLLAAERGDLKAVRRLLKAGAPAGGAASGAASLESFAPLHHAAARGHAAVARALLAAGADPEARTRSAEAALHLAAHGGHGDAARALLGAGADPDAKNEYDETPLFYAARKSHSAMVRLLLQHGADVTITNRFGDRASDETEDSSTRRAFLTRQVKERGLGRLQYDHLVQIFAYLQSRQIGTCGCVCSKWQGATEDKSLWQDRGRWDASLNSALGFGQAPTVGLLTMRPSSSRSIRSAEGSGGRRASAAAGGEGGGGPRRAGSAPPPLDGALAAGGGARGGGGAGTGGTGRPLPPPPPPPPGGKGDPPGDRARG